MDDFPVRSSEQLPALLQAFHKQSGLTQAEVALRLGVTQQTLSALERNADKVGTGRLLRLLVILGVELVLRTAPSAAPENGSSVAGESTGPAW